MNPSQEQESVVGLAGHPHVEAVPHDDEVAVGQGEGGERHGGQGGLGLAAVKLGPQLEVVVTDAGVAVARDQLVVVAEALQGFAEAVESVVPVPVLAVQVHGLQEIFCAHDGKVDVAANVCNRM